MIPVLLVRIHNGSLTVIVNLCSMNVTKCLMCASFLVSCIRLSFCPNISHLPKTIRTYTSQLFLRCGWVELLSGSNMPVSYNKIPVRYHYENVVVHHISRTSYLFGVGRCPVVVKFCQFSDKTKCVGSLIVESFDHK